MTVAPARGGARRVEAEERRGVLGGASEDYRQTVSGMERGSGRNGDDGKEGGGKLRGDSRGDSLGGDTAGLSQAAARCLVTAWPSPTTAIAAISPRPTESADRVSTRRGVSVATCAPRYSHMAGTGVGAGKARKVEEAEEAGVPSIVTGMAASYSSAELPGAPHCPTPPSAAPHSQLMAEVVVGRTPKEGNNRSCIDAVAAASSVTAQPITAAPRTSPRASTAATKLLRRECVSNKGDDGDAGDVFSSPMSNVSPSVGVNQNKGIGIGGDGGSTTPMDRLLCLARSTAAPSPKSPPL